ncbi:hypothetical protein ACIA8G_05925 [Lentzea sp. NPDC051213]|uniref:hypothetical protein n=1 Tax=Lentzea sp. NPDC051213 TaxID=3364126 RepID=UPI0037AEC713
MPKILLTGDPLGSPVSLDGERGPGPAWTVGHLAFLAVLGFFTWIFQDMVRRIGPRGRIFAVVAVAGAVALSGQFAVDVVAGFLAEDHAEMAAITRGVRTTPGISLYFYDFGPYLFYFGQLSLVVLLALGRHVGRGGSRG